MLSDTTLVKRRLALRRRLRTEFPIESEKTRVHTSRFWQTEAKRPDANHREADKLSNSGARKPRMPIDTTLVK
jgi:hypothetical protein